LKRINAQWSDEQRISKSDFVIVNVDSEIAKRKTEEILEDKTKGVLNVNFG
jgi:dephospho-CoA kinase